ncbi:MAG: TIGR03016 family PEP-CTERM system-associated outer membrane protein [Thiobacillus sp.]|nr:TIGR03016 family PEP-CTERM system-associated outer membrane protein [Thiobacillus sp.]
MVTMAVTANNRRPAGLRCAVLTKRVRLHTACAAALLVVCAAPASALDWQFEPSVGATATYTDNVNQRAANSQDALILSVSPGFSLRSKGSRRVQASLQYGLSAVNRFGGGADNDLFHHLDAAGKAELVEDLLYLDASARISQELISLLGSSADASTNSSNRTNVGTYLVSPYIKKRLGTFAEAEVRTTASGAFFGDNAAANSSVRAFSAHLASGTRFNDLNWALDYSIRKANNQNTRDTTFERANVLLGYGLTRKFRVFGTVGQDKNDYLSSTSTDGSSYSVGFGWAPSRRTSLEASVGERYFGRTYSLAANHRTRLSRWNIRYSEDVSDITQQFLEQSGRIFWVCGGRLIETPDATPPANQSCTQGPISAGQLAQAAVNLGVPVADVVAAGLLNVSTANGVFILKSLTAGVNWDVGRLGFGVSAQDTKRLYQVLGDAQDHIRGVVGSVSYRMSHHTTANTSLALTRTTFDAALAGGSSREEDMVSLSLGVTHRFASNLSGGLTLRHSQRDSTAATASYDENSISATANMQF